MSDEEPLLRAVAQERQERRGGAALATVVTVSGSAYRREGARMLVRPDGSRVGGVSGGCLEAEVVEHALAAVDAGRPRLLTFDTTDPDDAVFGYGSGCSGVVEVLVEPLVSPDAGTALRALASARTTREPAVLVTALSGPTTGARALWSGGTWRGSLAPRLDGLGVGDLLQPDDCPARRAGQLVLDSGRGPRLAWEVVEPPMRLVHVGADVGAPEVAAAARALGWDVTVLDYRPSLLDPDRFPPDVQLVACEGRGLSAHLLADPWTAVLVASRRWLYDLAAMSSLASAPADPGRRLAYVGLVGSADRTAALLARHGPPAAQVVRAPAGRTATRARTPAEIAAGVVAEILHLRPQHRWWPRRATAG